jgi:hypothetical protein
MDIQVALHDLSEALTDGAGTHEARLRLARRILIDRGIEALKVEFPRNPTLDSVVRAATTAPQTPARRAFAVLIVHALATRGLVPTGSIGDVCTLIESALLHSLIRCGYPFGASIYEKRQALDRLRTNIDELLEPLEPTFPNWQGLYAG